MPKSKLSPRQRLVRRELIRSKGMTSNREMADMFGVNRVTIWKDRQAIKKHRPIPEDEYVEEVEIQQALDHFRDMTIQLMDELEENEMQIEAYGDSPSVVGFLNIRVNLINQLRQVQSDRRSFLLEIGYITATTKRFSVETPISDVKEDAKIQSEIDELDEKIALIEGQINEPSQSAKVSRAKKAETETLPIPAKEDDRL